MTTSDFLFIIHTTNYAGNFERGMCAYITGIIGDCMVGAKDAEEAQRELSRMDFSYMEEHIDLKSEGDDQCYRPTTIYPTPEWFNNGMGGHFIDGEEDRALKHLIEECEEYNKIHPNELKIPNTLNKYPAYLSVAIYLNEQPPDNIFNLMVDRAKSYAQLHKINITHFELIEEITTIEHKTRKTTAK